MKRKLSLFLALVMILTSIFVTGASATGEDQELVDSQSSNEVQNADDQATEEAESEVASSQSATYEDYKAANGDFANAEAEIVIDATSYATAKDAEVNNLDTFKPENGEERETVVEWKNEDGFLTYNVNVPADGL